MSVQLILYPQNYNGTYTYTSNPVLNQYVANGNFTSGINSTTGSAAAHPSYTTLTTNTPISNWKAWQSTGGTYASVSSPLTSSAGLTLYGGSSSTAGSTGVYQLIGNLTVGVTYELTLDITNFSSGSIYIGAYWGLGWTFNSVPYINLGQVVGTNYPSTSVSGGKITHTFTAAGGNEVFILEYQGINGDNLVVSNISITENPATAPLIYTDLSDGQVICDLYEEEAIPLSLSIDDFKNVTEKTQSYSKDFHLPNTKRNNKIFGHIFEVSRSTDAFSFNPYIKTRAILKEDSYTLFEGYLRLIDINDKEGEISYNVNLYSEAVALADILKESILADLDFDELAHEYNQDTIKDSWEDNTGLPLTNTITSSSYAYDSSLTSPTDHTSVLKYPFIDWTHNFAIGGFGNPNLTSLEQAFRPCIQVKYLIDKIFEPTPFTFQSTLFDSTEFGKLFMDFNWGSAGTPSLSNTSTYQSLWAKQMGSTTNSSVYAGTSFTSLELKPHTNFPVSALPPNYDSSTNTITATADGEQYTINATYRIENTSVSATQTIECRFLHYDNSTTTSPPLQVQNLTIPPESYVDYTVSFSKTLMTNDTLKAQFKRSNPLSTNTVRQYESSTTPTAAVIFNISIAAVTTGSLLQTLRGEIKQWEFLKGIMTMFNLISISDRDDPNKIIIEPYADILLTNSDSTQRNWTDKVDMSEIKLEPLTELNKKTIFKFVEEDDDYAFKLYKTSVNGHLYGSKIFDASGFTVLDGEEEIVAEPFAATISKPLETQFSDFITPSIYKYNEDQTTEGFENAPRILYNNGKKTLTSCTYKIPLQNGVAATNAETEFLQFSHLSDIPTIAGTTTDFHFGECQLIPPLIPVSDNLYQTYWSPYYNELYHSDTRIMTLKVNLTPADIQNFKFYDTVVIKNREYRVNKIEYKPNTLAKVEFILIP